MIALAAPKAELEVLWLMLTGTGDIRDDLLIDHRLQEQHFADPARQAIFTAIVTAHDEGARDELTVAAIAPAVKDDPRCNEQTAQTALRELAKAYCAAHDISVHIKALDDLRRRRDWQRASALIGHAATSGDRAALAQAEQLLHDQPGKPTDRADPARLAELVADYMAATGDVAMTTGLPSLDDATGGGLRPGDTSALAAWTGFGKSAYVDQILELHAHRGRNVHAYVNEMSFVDRGLRMVAANSKVPFWRLSRRQLRPEDADRVMATLSKGLPFGVTDCSSWDPDQIVRDIKARRWDLCCLDVLHNLPYRDVAELDRIIATLAGAARTANTHLILVCHLNQERAKDRIQPAPVLRDIRGSGMIKNVCASVLLLHREQTTEGAAVQLEKDGVIYDAKHRHGPGGSALMLFDPKRMRFTELVKPAVVSTPAPPHWTDREAA